MIDGPYEPLPDAPVLANPGPWPVGVTTQTVTLASVDGPRSLVVEVFYPCAATVAAGGVRHRDHLGRLADDPSRPATPFEFVGHGTRDVALAGGPWPLVVVSHGYPGSRVIMSDLCEHLASIGCVVAAIDHPGSVHGAVGPFRDTLVHRATDILGVRDALPTLVAGDPLLDGGVDADRCVLVGYSMGGYGVLSALGAGYTERFVTHPRTAPDGALAARRHPIEASEGVLGAVLFAPWGGANGVFDPAGLASLRTPLLFVAGREDDVVGWDPGVFSLFEACSNSERLLLELEGCRHNPAPNPPPTAARSHPEDWAHYAEPAWDPLRLLGIRRHFVRAFVEHALSGDAALPPALDLIERAADGAVIQSPTGPSLPGEDHWWGFEARTAVAMRMHRRRPSDGGG